MNDKNIIDVSEAEFNDQVVEASSNKLIIVDFWAPWCGPCKQLTPILEKIIKGCGDKVTLVKINIDDNQQIAAQLRIQSIPTVYAFKDKQILNAFQGVLPEKQIIDFIEKCLGSKINEDFSEFYNQIKLSMSENKFEETKDVLLEFISKNPDEIKAISAYLECLIELKQFEEVDEFIQSLEKEIQDKDEIKQLVKKLEIIKSNMGGPNIEELIIELNKKPNDIDLIIEIADKYFSMQKYDESMEILLKNYSKNKAKVKEKMLEFFAVLGNSNEYTITYRKRLSQIMFS
tara:strand:+ start:551 stop:1414 length:864 start_codon:yes stop_codon:yes gene_type:complete